MNNKFGMIGLIFIGICMVIAVNRYKSYDRSVSVKGLCEKEVMAEEATANARQVAQKFAEDSKSRLGKIKRASQGQFSVTNRDSNTPYIKKVRVVTSVTYYLKN